MLDVARESRCGVCLMHMQGSPRTMQDNPTYGNVVGDVLDYLRDRRTADRGRHRRAANRRRSGHWLR